MGSPSPLASPSRRRDARSPCHPSSGITCVGDVAEHVVLDGQRRQQHDLRQPGRTEVGEAAGEVVGRADHARRLDQLGRHEVPLLVDHPAVVALVDALVQALGVGGVEHLDVALPALEARVALGPAGLLPLLVLVVDGGDGERPAGQADPFAASRSSPGCSTTIVVSVAVRKRLRSMVRAGVGGGGVDAGPRPLEAVDRRRDRHHEAVAVAHGEGHRPRAEPGDVERACAARTRRSRRRA